MGAPAIAPAQAPTAPAGSTDRTIIKAMMNDGTVEHFALPGTLDNASISAATGDLVRQLGGVQSIQAFTPGALAQPLQEGIVEGLFNPERSPGIGAPGRLADVTAAQVPESLAGFTRGAVERFIEPSARLSGLLTGGALGVPPQGALQTGADLLASGFNFTPAGFGLSMKGVATQGIAEIAGAPPNTARMLAAGVEVGTGVISAFRAGRTAFKGKPGVKLVEGAETTAKEARKVTLGTPRLSPKEAAGLDLKNIALDKINTAAKIHGDRLEAVENFIKAQRPKITIDDPDYVKVQELVGSAVGDDIVSLLPGPVKALIRKMNTAMGHTKVDPTTKVLVPDPLPVSMTDLVSIRRIMGRREVAANVLDKAARKLARGFRKEVTNIIEKGAPRQDLMTEFAAARMAYQLEVITPKQALSQVLRSNVTPQQAFNKIFSVGEGAAQGDTAIFRALHDHIGKIPGVRDKLRLGFIESLGDFAGDVSQLQKAGDSFVKLQPALTSTGLYTTLELREIGRAITSRSIPNMVQRLMGGVTRLAEKGGPGNALLGTLAILNPKALFGVIVASGSVGLLRKMQLSTASSPAERKLYGAILARITAMAARLNAAEKANVDIVTAPDDDTMPELGRGVRID